MAVALLAPSPWYGWRPVSTIRISPPSPSLLAVSPQRGDVAPATCGVALGLALAAGQRCSGDSRGPAARPWQLQAKAKKDDSKSYDGLVALGCILQAATDAYKASVQEQVDSEKRLRAEMEEKVEKLLAEVETLKASVQTTTFLGLSLEDIVGVWFDEASKGRVRVAENGTCVFDNGQKNTVSVDGTDLKLASGFVLSKPKSSRKRLVWEKGEQSAEWLYEMPGGSWQVTLKLDFGSWLHGKDPYRHKNYNFSIANCEARLVFKQSTEDPNKVGAFLGFPKSNHGLMFQPDYRYVPAFTCRAQVDLWDPKGETWLNLFRTSVQRYEQGGTAYGKSSVMTVARLRKILPKEVDRYGEGVRSARVRVTVTDRGLIEISDGNNRLIHDSIGRDYDDHPGGFSVYESPRNGERILEPI